MRKCQIKMIICFPPKPMFYYIFFVLPLSIFYLTFCTARSLRNKYLFNFAAHACTHTHTHASRTRKSILSYFPYSITRRRCALSMSGAGGANNSQPERQREKRRRYECECLTSILQSTILACCLLNYMCTFCTQSNTINQLIKSQVI